MGQTSDLGYVVHLNNTSHTSDRPVDTGRSWTVVNNARHLYDEHFQHRINWVAGVLPSEATASEFVVTNTAAGVPLLYEATVPWTIKADGMPANIDLAVGCRRRTGSGTQTISANVLHADAGVDYTGAFTPSDSYWGTSTTYASSTAGWAIDAQKIFDVDTDYDAARMIQSSRRSFLVRNGSGQSLQPAAIAFVKLLVKISYSGSTGEKHTLTGILLREFV